MVAYAARGFLRAVVAVNRWYLRQNPNIPDLYQAGVVFRREPWAGVVDEFADIPTILERGWGDCDDLVSYRVAWLKERAYGFDQRGREPDAGIKIYWRKPRRSAAFNGKRGRLFHAQVRRQNGEVEDPSRLLGM